jgi:hypothetical protein
MRFSSDGDTGARQAFIRRDSRVSFDKATTNNEGKQQ